MDAVSDIKARLPIEELVRQYCQLTKKGRNFIALCPFHHDTRPSFLVSPDKGICYCFPCQKGGDIFSFYQLIEGVDFPQALKELAEKTGVKLEQSGAMHQKKDEKEKLRECLEAASIYYRKNLQSNAEVKTYLASRGVTEQEMTEFEIGFAPDSFNETYEHLLKMGFSRKEIQMAGMAVQKELSNDRMYDRFRNRLMFPIHDIQGRIIGFGGRAMGNDDAKYLNSAETPLYRKSQVLFGIHQAREAIREKKRVVIVEGYFDVLACHRAGIKETVASCGTALTEDHVRLLKRYADSVVLCMDQDNAGKQAMERAFMLCSKGELQVMSVVLREKDPADVAVQDIRELTYMLENATVPYLDTVLEEVGASNLSSPTIRTAALQRLLALLDSVPTATERSHWVRRIAETLSTTVTALEEDLKRFSMHQMPAKKNEQFSTSTDLFSSIELTLGLLMLYPRNLTLLQELIPPEEDFTLALYEAMKSLPEGSTEVDIGALNLPTDFEKRARILELYCEENGFQDWNDSGATREIRKNAMKANKDVLHKKLQQIKEKLLIASKSGNVGEEELLRTQNNQLLKLYHKASIS